MGKEPAGIALGPPPPFMHPPSFSRCRKLWWCWYFCFISSWCLWQCCGYGMIFSGSWAYFSVGFGSGSGSCLGSSKNFSYILDTNFIFVFLPCKCVWLLIMTRYKLLRKIFFWTKRNLYFLIEHFSWEIAKFLPVFRAVLLQIHVGSGAARIRILLRVSGPNRSGSSTLLCKYAQFFYFLRRLRLVSTKLLNLVLRGCVISPGILWSFLWYGLGNLIYLFERIFSLSRQLAPFWSADCFATRQFMRTDLWLKGQWHELIYEDYLLQTVQNFS